MATLTIATTVTPAITCVMAAAEIRYIRWEGTIVGSTVDVSHYGAVNAVKLFFWR